MTGGCTGGMAEPPPHSLRRLSDAPTFPSLPAEDKIQTQDVGQAFADFLRFAEELQQKMAPGMLDLDERPAAMPEPRTDDAEDQSILARVFRFRRRGKKLRLAERIVWGGGGAGTRGAPVPAHARSSVPSPQPRRDWTPRRGESTPRTLQRCSAHLHSPLLSAVFCGASGRPMAAKPLVGLSLKSLLLCIKEKNQHLLACSI